MEAQMEWATEFNALLTQQGQELCVSGYEGFLRTGSKGAVAVSERLLLFWGVYCGVYVG